MADNYYYKIVNDNTGSVDFYVSVDVLVKDDVCQVLCLKGHHAESITKAEFDRETMDE